ncbi:hypothetical protein J4E93_010983 [Alternaria ventricosa]|uniref:uncharacterized protein n=1 Tax=Alternaria ventricosa TaxID=1187951 RepID=UPI0020C41C75|nr:uncharacterized protein J4E93_010983 [Alternaria ventricosa]KAI4636758.1 hypothetical protein J4E93_010983 [Alternaria ventricosa]
MDRRVSPWDKRKRGGGKALEKMTGERTLPEVLKARIKVVHPKCGDFMFGDRGAKDFEGLGLDLEATMGLAHENIFLDMSHKQARQRLLDETKDDWSSQMSSSSIWTWPASVDVEEWESITKEEASINMTAKESRNQLLKVIEKDWHSTRVDKLIEQILSLHESKSERKIIITDEFLQTLNVVSNALKATGIEFLEHNGHMNLKERDAVRERFNDPKDKVGVMLATIQCFGLGLALVEAANMFILTPRWNPAIDAQAASRINRIGQNRRVTIWTFYAHNSIERYVERERERKKKKAVLTLDQKGVSEWLRRKMESLTEAKSRCSCNGHPNSHEHLQDQSRIPEASGGGRGLTTNQAVQVLTLDLAHLARNHRYQGTGYRPSERALQHN